MRAVLRLRTALRYLPSGLDSRMTPVELAACDGCRYAVVVLHDDRAQLARATNDYDAARGCRDRWKARGHRARVIDLGPPREDPT